MQRAALGAVRAGPRLCPPPARSFGASRPVPAAAPDKEALLALRRRTGLPFVHCREALLRFGTDLPQAEAWLAARAQEEGWSKATKLQGRAAREGLLGLLHSGQAAVMVEVSCETDFVARNANFQQLVQDVALATMAHCGGAAEPPATCTKVRFPPPPPLPPPAGSATLRRSLCLSQRFLGTEELSRVRMEPGGAELRDRLALAIGKMGENMALRRAAWLAVPQGCHIAWYVHGSPPAAAPPAPNTAPPAPALGKYGALVACRAAGAGPPGPEAAALCRQVAQHVVGMAPLAVGSPEDEPGGEGERRLLAQEFLLGPGATVAQVLRPHALAVLDFVRFCCGEEAAAGAGQEEAAAARG
ncbi:elongation factor Ts, mitochondrial isoform X1 [Anser cygnoides]|uniref:elongation factor Ts, mitochondrial isoform X1 n=1 Tax=Anser cygnoides TaxID=8845 RepID=UPI0034D27A77